MRRLRSTASPRVGPLVLVLLSTLVGKVGALDLCRQQSAYCGTCSENVEPGGERYEKTTKAIGGCSCLGLSFPVYRVTAGNIRENEIKGITVDGNPYNSIPLFTEKGITRRQCTGDYKIKPVRKKTRSLLNLAPKERKKGVYAEHWIGISRDEIQRVKDSDVRYIRNRWPLLEKQMERRHCLEWFAEHYPDRTLARSACLGCPYNSNTRWRELKINSPEDFADVVDFDAKVRKLADMDFYVHKSCKPIDEVDFRNLEDMGQLSFLDECDGMCGV